LDNPLPRVNFPKQLVPIHSDDESRRALATLDPTATSLVPADAGITSQDGSGAAEVREYTPGHYLIHFKCATPSLLRVSSAYFPGWTARSGSQSLRVLPVDHALTGIAIPAGEGDISLDYHSTYFLPAGILSLLALAMCAGILAWDWRRI
jgi:hypothetical protein